MMNLIGLLNDIIGSDWFLLSATSISFILKIFIFGSLIYTGIQKKIPKNPWIFLILVLGASMLEDFAWIIKLGTQHVFTGLDYRFTVFFIRLAWAFKGFQYQILALFIGSLVEKNYRINLYQKLGVLVASCFSFYFIYLAVFQFNFIDPKVRFANEVPVFLWSISLILFLSLLPILFLSMRKVKAPKFPKLLKNQFSTLVKLYIGPYIISDVIQITPFPGPVQDITATFPIASISTVLLTYAIIYCSRRVIGLRFLNFTNHVQSITQFNFIDDFKNILERLGYATSKRELGQITQTFFKDALNIRQNKTAIYIRTNKIDTAHDQDDEPQQISSLERVVENFITMHDKDACNIKDQLHQTKIFINDEIEFNNFYESTEDNNQILHFLDEINADVFLPVYEKNIISGYIIIERNARTNEFYSDIERDEMVVFASYLGNIINLIQNRNLNTLIEREKSLQEELYRKHQEINQYKESIRSFLRHNKEQRKIGIIFYKQRKFIFGNQAAQEMIDININSQLGHPITKKLRTIVQRVEEYKSAQEAFGQDAQGNKLVFSAIPNLEKNNVIIIISYPEIADIIKKQIDILENPSEWDYLLYLETTKSGQLINQLIPGTGAALLNFKINLLKTALSKDALLLDIPQDDLIPTVEMLNHISLRENLYVLTLKDYEKNFDTSIKLFGINPIFGIHTEQPLLEKLDNSGTLFIQNVHLLHQETQSYLADYLQYGYFTVFKSEKKVRSSVRIICSSNQNLEQLVQQEKFSKTLFAQLKKTTVSMPSIMSLSEEEVNTLADGFTEQALKTQTFKTLLELTEKEKKILSNSRPLSLQEFKEKVQNMLISKSKTHNIYHETQFDPAYKITDPDLTEAARLGKKALKDPKTMALLWNKFKNQNKIATFLDVNRSSVNRRCKEYNLI